MSEFETYGYGIVDTGDGLELQRSHKAGIFTDDRQAGRACRNNALDGDTYAKSIVYRLSLDCAKRSGIGRGGLKHDYLMHRLDSLPLHALPLKEIDNER